ncbi:MAG TPA: phage head-tail adapter protein, partial [Lactobacillus sp.]|nr:phage head-tail adapter protein [Lactobacillus sp.]
VKYGLDGIAVNSKNELYVGNYGDAEIERIKFNTDGSYAGYEPFAQDLSQLNSTDGITFDDADNMYVADFDKNSIAKVTPDGKVERIAQNGDNDGQKGEVNQPGETRPWNGKLMISNFNLVTGPTKVNTGHSIPQVVSYLDLEA